MTPEQRLEAIRQRLFADEELTQLLKDAVEHYAFTALRKTYLTNDCSDVLTQKSFAEGSEAFVKEITKAPGSRSEDRD